jgi:putative sterol carrier protein
MTQTVEQVRVPDDRYYETTSVRDAIVDVIQASAHDEHLGERVAFSKTTVVLHFTDADDVAATLVLEQSPLEAVARELPNAEISIYATTAQWDAFWKGELQLAMAIARGEVTYRGTVRKFLRAVPILRRLAGDYRRARVERARLAQEAADLEDLRP